MKSPLEKLKELAINFKIEANDKLEKVVPLETIVKVLSDINQSFKQFVEYEFKNHPLYYDFFEKNPKILADFISSLELLIVDAKIGSYQSAIAPNLIEIENPLFKDEVLDFKKTAFINYKTDVTYLDFQNQEEINRIVSKYPEEYRIKIYKPYLNAYSSENKYSILLLDKFDRPIRNLVPPDELRKKQIIPSFKSPKPLKKNQVIKGYFLVNSEGDRIELNKTNIKKVYDIEILEHDTYPYKPLNISFENHVFILNDRLACEVEFENNSYIIRNNDLDLTAWGDSREEAEEAFSFSFYSLYINYVMEAEDKLSVKALELRNKLHSLIKTYYNENPKD